jgi:ubiquinol-cytochrome c reductase core subunit 2
MTSASFKHASLIMSLIPKRYSSSSASSVKYSSPPGNTFVKPEQLKVSTLENGIKVASVENFSPITRIAAVINVGSRDEEHHEQGALHALRIYSNLATKNYSSFGVTRTLDQCGANFSVTSSREQLTYVLENKRDQT